MYIRCYSPKPLEHPHFGGIIRHPGCRVAHQTTLHPVVFTKRGLTLGFGGKETAGPDGVNRGVPRQRGALRWDGATLGAWWAGRLVVELGEARRWGRADAPLPEGLKRENSSGRSDTAPERETTRPRPPAHAGRPRSGQRQGRDLARIGCMVRRLRTVGTPVTTVMATVSRLAQSATLPIGSESWSVWPCFSPGPTPGTRLELHPPTCGGRRVLYRASRNAPLRRQRRGRDCQCP